MAAVLLDRSGDAEEHQIDAFMIEERGYRWTLSVTARMPGDGTCYEPGNGRAD
jgi:hypothetical protein